MALPDIEEVRRQCREWQPIMRVADWIIEIEFVSRLRMKELTNDQDDNVALAYVTTCRKRKWATIYFNQDDDDNETNWKHNLAHEMNHILADDMDYHVECIVVAVPDERQREILRDAYRIYLERLVDDLAKCFVATQSIQVVPVTATG